MSGGKVAQACAQAGQRLAAMADAVLQRLVQFGGGLVVAREGGARFSWDYAGARGELGKLYDKAKRSQWNATTDIDWSIDVDPLDTGGLASYLPMIAAESFARFSADVEEWRRRLVCDATTSGGLLVALPPERAAEVPGAVVGRLVDGATGTITVNGGSSA